MNTLPIYLYKFDNCEVDENEMILLAEARGFVRATTHPVVEAATYLANWCKAEGHTFKWIGVKPS